MLRNFKYIKTTAVKPKATPSTKRAIKAKKCTGAGFLEEFRHAIEELNEVKTGRKQARLLKDVLNEL